MADTVTCPVAAVEVCTGGADEDGDLAVDCADSDCAADTTNCGDLDGDGILNGVDADQDGDGLDASIDPNVTVANTWWYVWPVLDDDCDSATTSKYTPTQVTGSTYEFVKASSAFSFLGPVHVSGVESGKSSGMFSECFAADYAFNDEYAISSIIVCKFYDSNSVLYAGEWDGICIEY